MVVLDGTNQGIGKEIRKKIVASSAYGLRKYGSFHYGAGANIYGIYRVRHLQNKTIQEKMEFYVPTNPQTGPQQANRQKMTNGVVAWQALTPEEQTVYNKRAKEKNLYGFNLFLSEYLLSH